MCEMEASRVKRALALAEVPAPSTPQRRGGLGMTWDLLRVAEGFHPSSRLVAPTPKAKSQKPSFVTHGTAIQRHAWRSMTAMATTTFPAVERIANFTPFASRRSSSGHGASLSLSPMMKSHLRRPIAPCNLGIAAPVLLGNAGRSAPKLKSWHCPTCSSRAELVDTVDACCRLGATGARGLCRGSAEGPLADRRTVACCAEQRTGLRTGRLLSDVLLYEDTLAGETRLVGITDGGLNVLPTLEQKQQIVQNAIEVMRCLGITPGRRWPS